MFNELLESVGIRPNDVCVIRHHTPERGKTYATLHDLWRNDPDGFERYQATQLAERPIFRNRKIWAAFVNPTPEETIFVGLYDATLAETRKAAPAQEQKRAGLNRSAVRMAAFPPTG